MDLKLRGPGEFFGTKQSGLPSLRIANILRDPDILVAAKHEARAFVEEPPSPEAFAKAVEYIKGHWQRRYGLVQVG
jgi:ATP-dependent DNA helicase RecG